MIKLIWKICVAVLVFAENTQTQFINLQMPTIADILNNVTINDVSNVLRQFPLLPHPLIFNGFPISDSDVTYFLYTRRNPDIGVPLKGTSTRFPMLDPSKDVKFVIHGWLESTARPYIRGFIDAYLRRGEYNVIGLDWARPAQSEYSISARNCKTVGKHLAEFILRLNRTIGVPFENIHILGHSLGAHLGGFAGKEIIRRTGKKIGRISALDAAGPLYETPIPIDKNNRLEFNDAEFVDCIHTDGGIFGMTIPIGHVDFFPNGGVPRQPGCAMINIRELSTKVILEDMFCSHSRSYEFFIDSINTDKLRGVQCSSYQDFKAGLCANNQPAIMGEDADWSIRGLYYLDTTANRPFASI